MKTKFLLVLLAILLPLMVGAESIEIGGIYYNLTYNAGKVQFAEVTSRPDKYLEELNMIVHSKYFGNIVIPESVTHEGVNYCITSIGDLAFWGCTGLTSVTIPNSVTNIGDQAFDGCSSLTSVTIPNSVTNIGDGAFSSCTGLTSVTIGNSVKDIGDGAFYNCTGLTSVTIPNSTESIAGNAFCNCKGLTSVTIGSSVTNIGDHAFNFCTGLTSVTIPNSTESIEAFAFWGCTGLTSVTIGNSVKDIGDLAFWNCTGLTSVTIPNSVTNIGDGAFSGCKGLTDVYFMSESAPHAMSAFYKEVVNNVTIHVKDYAIESFKGVEPWTLFKEIVCDEIVTDFNLIYYVDGEVYKIETHKYDDAIVSEPEPTRKGMTFSGWDAVPEKMPGKDIEVNGTFSWSKKTVDNVIYEVYDATNNYCKAIANESASGAVKIEEAVDFDDSYNVTTITDNTFNGCKNITSIEIPATVTTIGERAFANIDKLTDVTVLATDLPETDRTAFENSYINDYVTLHVPEASLEKYNTTAPWKNFKEVVGIAGPKKCATPTITFADGKVKFACETEGVTFKYEIKNADNFKGEGDEIEVGGVYNVSVYATKDDYIDSEKATTQIKLSTVKGDINGDGKVDVRDHVELSNIIMGIHEEEAESEQEETE